MVLGQTSISCEQQDYYITSAGAFHTTQQGFLDTAVLENPNFIFLSNEETISQECVCFIIEMNLFHKMIYEPTGEAERKETLGWHDPAA